MEAYTAFAKVYDKFMENVPYSRWADFLEEIIEKVGVSQPNRESEDALESERNLVLDLGCGTGVLTRLMYDKGYDMIGIDLSQEMLDEAMEANADRQIMYICQDMCEIDLYSTVGTIISTCDSINYLLEDAEVEQCFDKVDNYLYPGGIFVFDFNTVHKYRDVIGDTTIAENDESGSFIWDNFYDEEGNINEYDLTLFIKENDSELFRREVEIHYQRGYDVDEMMDFVRNAGLEVIAAIDERCIGDVNVSNVQQAARVGIDDDSERVFIIARKMT